MISRIAKFILSALAVWGSDFLVFLALYPHVNLGIAVFAARAIGGVVGFTLHKWFSFGSVGKPTSAEVTQFTALWFTNYALSIAGIGAILGTTTAAPAVAKLIVDIIIFMSNFLILGRIFKSRR